MHKQTRTTLIISGAVALIGMSVALGTTGQKRVVAPPPPVVVVEPPVHEGKIQVALLLDTSSSMDGLIDQARSQLWKVVSRLDLARRAGKRPTLEIALYEYGNPGRANEEAGWIRQVLPMTSDLDRVSEALFALTTNGGDEYAGQVITKAVKDLEWSRDAADLKMIFIAGNESFEQGPIAPKDAMVAAREHGVNVTVIHCGGDDPTWRAGAMLAGTDYMQIDQDQVVVHVAAPQDAEIMRLGVLLNGTYIPYGAQGVIGAERQKEQDGNAEHAQAGSMVWRSVAKSSSSYGNAGWDLGDAITNGLTLDKLEETDMPDAMRTMTAEERTAYVKTKMDERANLQKQIQDLNKEREQFVAAELAKQTENGAASLDSALLGAVQTQAKSAGFRFE
jgi:hypothetical protein